MNPKYMIVKYSNFDIRSWNIEIETKHISFDISIFRNTRIGNINPKHKCHVSIRPKMHGNVKTYTWYLIEENPMPNKYKEIVDSYIVMYLLDAR